MQRTKGSYINNSAQVHSRFIEQIHTAPFLQKHTWVQEWCIYLDRVPVSLQCRVIYTAQNANVGSEKWPILGENGMLPEEGGKLGQSVK